MTRSEWFYLVLAVTVLGGIFFLGIVLGDVNRDGLVNSQDAEPFIDSISTWTFAPKDAVDQNGVVNLLDVKPFKVLLKGY